MEAEAAEAIRIADKYLPNGSSEQRCALAKEILVAIKDHGQRMAFEVIDQVASSMKRREH